MQMREFVAVCHGGPWDGKRYVHYAKRLLVVEFPPMRITASAAADGDTEPPVTHSYRYDETIEPRWEYEGVDAA